MQALPLEVWKDEILAKSAKYQEASTKYGITNVKGVVTGPWDTREEAENLCRPSSPIAYGDADYKYVGYDIVSAIVDAPQPIQGYEIVMVAGLSIPAGKKYVYYCVKVYAKEEKNMLANLVKFGVPMALLVGLIYVFFFGKEKK